MSEQKSRKQTWYVLAALVTLFVSLAIVASLGMQDWERSILTAVYGTGGHWRWLAVIVTQAGSAWTWLAIVALFLIVRRRPGIALSVFRNGLLVYAGVLITKYLVGRPRPDEFMSNVISREVVTLGFGFPSGHVAAATVLSLTLARHMKGHYKLLIPAVWIGAVAWSRLYLGVHAPFDVLGGFVLGVMVVQATKLFPQKGIWKQ